MVVHAGQRLDGGAALHLVVIAADQVLFAADVRVRQQAQQRVAQVFVGRRLPGRRVRRLPDGAQAAARDAVVQERHADIAHQGVAVVQAQPPGGFKSADAHRLDVLPGADRLHARPVGRGHGQHHAFLGLAQPDFPGAQAGILQRHVGKLHARAHVLAHLAHRRRQAARAAVGDGAVQALVAGAQHSFLCLLLVDRVADLHRAAGDRAGRLVKLHAGEGRAAQAVAPGASADHHDQVAGPRAGAVAAARQNPQAAAEHQRVRGVAGVIEHGPVDGGDAHLIAVVLDAGGHASRDAQRVQHTRLKRLVRQVRRAEAQHVGVGDGPGADAQHVADHAADAGVGAAERLDGRRAVVRFDLERQVVLFVEGDDARVVHEGRPHPGPVHALGGGADVRLEQAVHSDAALRPGVVNQRLERLVDAVFAPGLRQHFQLGVGGVAAFRLKTGADGLHLGQVEGEAALGAEGQQRVVVRLAQRDHLDCVVRRLKGDERRRDRAVQAVALDHRVGEHLDSQPAQVGGGERAAEQEALAGGGPFQAGAAQQAGGAHQVFGGGVGYTGEQREFYGMIGVRVDCAKRIDFSDRVGQQVAGQFVGVRGAEPPLQKVEPPAAAGRQAGDAKLARRFQRAGVSGLAGAREHLNTVHRRRAGLGLGSAGAGFVVLQADRPLLASGVRRTGAKTAGTSRRL